MVRSWLRGSLYAGWSSVETPSTCVTSTLVDLDTSPSRHTTVATVDGARVHSLATTLRYRWMGITPTLPWWLAMLPRPDVVHVYGFRDPVTTVTAGWCRARRIPYVFEPLGMFHPRLRKVGLKRALDSSLYRGVASGATSVIVVVRARGRRGGGRRDSTGANRRPRQRVSGSGRHADRHPTPPYGARDRRRRAHRPLRGQDRGGQGGRVLTRGSATAKVRTRRPRGSRRPPRDDGSRRVGTARRRDAGPYTCASSRGRAAALALPRGQRLCARFVGGQLRHGRRGGRRVGHARSRQRPCWRHWLLPRGGSGDHPRRARGDRRRDRARPRGRFSPRNACSKVDGTRRDECPGTGSPTSRSRSTAKPPRALPPRTRRPTARSPSRA